MYEVNTNYIIYMIYKIEIFTKFWYATSLILIISNATFLQIKLLNDTLSWISRG